jgi:hypothetical protein
MVAYGTLLLFSRLLTGWPASNCQIAPHSTACACKAGERDGIISGHAWSEESYLIVACTVITDVPEAVGPFPVALIAKVSLPLYRVFAVYS